MAHDPNTIWEVRATGSITNGGAFRWVGLVNATYRWTLSGDGTAEYYCELAAGGNPNLAQPLSVTLDGNFNLATAGVVGSLAAGEWAWDDNDGLGFDTLYVRLADDTDPDSKIAMGHPDFVQMGYGGGQDYSQQAAAQLSLGDIATDAAGTQLTSVTGGFTAAMVGNEIYLTGGGATTSWYQIATYIDGNNITIDRSAGANKITVTGNVGGALTYQGMNAHIGGFQMVAGNRMYIGSGTYAPANDQSFGIGTATLLFRFIGYHATRGDVCVGTDRPLFTTRVWQFNTLTVAANLRVQASAGSGGVLSSSNGACCFFNCWAENTAVGGGSHALVAAGVSNVLVGCEGVTAGGATSYGITVAGQAVAVGCYSHNSHTGIHLNGLGTTAIGCIVDTCTWGILHSFDGTAEVNCTHYDCDIGTRVLGAKTVGLVNVAYEGCDQDILSNQASIQHNIFALHNCCGGTTPFTMAASLMGNVFAVPGMLNPAAGDFRIGLNDPVAKKAADAGTFTTARTY